MDTPQTPPAANEQNPFRTAARAVKARKLSAAIDGAFNLLGVYDPESQYDCVCGMAGPGWAAAAAQAQVAVPSEDTQRIVCELYAERVRASVDAQIARAVAGALKAAGVR